MLSSVRCAGRLYGLLTPVKPDARVAIEDDCGSVVEQSTAGESVLKQIPRWVSLPSVYECVCK